MQQLPMPQSDYPAAHSMDCEWFAVDENGFVAVMSSGEDGPIPVEFELFRTKRDYDAFQFMEEVEKSIGKKALSDQFDIPLPASIGLYHYEHTFDVETDDEQSWVTMTPYERVGVPEEPLHVSQLPDELAKKAQIVAFNNVSFSNLERMQPLGKPDIRCVFWGDGDYYKFYLDEQLQSHPMTESMVASDTNLVSELFSKKTDGRPWWKRLFWLE
ncbi:MAG: hypothetical protein K2X93_02865 [Candidatus Obscuribacterales bacterium]|nr:hypothetical protein [Candidatus Obscuribacterales bacterium]